MRYIYRVEIIKANVVFSNDNKRQEKQLNTAGQEGWKLVTISEGKKFMKYIYIKEIM